MSEGLASEFRLEAFTKCNPVTWQNEGSGPGPSSIKPLALPSTNEVASEKFPRQVGSVGVANALKFHKSKSRKKRANRGSSSWSRDSKESIGKRHSGEGNVPSLQVDQTSPKPARNTGEGDQVVETDSMAAPSTTEPASNSGKLITECATTWSIFGFGITSIYTGNQILYAKTGDDTFPKFYAWILLPVCVTAQVISFLLKPRREDSFYKAFLYTQYSIK